MHLDRLIHHLRRWVTRFSRPPPAADRYWNWLRIAVLLLRLVAVVIQLTG